ncbi:g9146 [Coccomyxa elongata]
MLQECKKRGVRPAYVVSKTIVATKEDDPPGLERAKDVTALFERGVISQEAFNKKDMGRMERGNYVEITWERRELADPEGISEGDTTGAAGAQIL